MPYQPLPHIIICTSFISSIDYNVFIVFTMSLKRTFVWFYHTRPQAVYLHNLTYKNNVLLINGKRYAKENKDCRVGLYSNKQISYHDNLRSLQSSIIAPRTENNYYAILAFSCHTI